MNSKSKIQCEAHYYAFYHNKENNILNDADFLKKGEKGGSRVIDNQKKEDIVIATCKDQQGKIPEFTINKEKSNNSSRSIVKNRNRKDQKVITSAAEILGFWEKREEFENEFLNDAELELSELEFIEGESKADFDLKMNVLKVYNCQLMERDKRKRFIIDRGLLDIKKTSNYERKLPKDDREIYTCLKPFARMIPKEQFNNLFEGIILEKNLRQRLNQLKYFK